MARYKEEALNLELDYEEPDREWAESELDELKTQVFTSEIINLAEELDEAVYMKKYHGHEISDEFLAKLSRRIKRKAKDFA